MGTQFLSLFLFSHMLSRDREREDVKASLEGESYVAFPSLPFSWDLGCACICTLYVFSKLQVWDLRCGIGHMKSSHFNLHTICWARYPVFLRLYLEALAGLCSYTYTPDKEWILLLSEKVVLSDQLCFGKNAYGALREEGDTYLTN